MGMGGELGSERFFKAGQLRKPVRDVGDFVEEIAGADAVVGIRRRKHGVGLKVAA